MGMYVFEIVPVQNLAPTFDYDLSVTASSDSSTTTNEVFQFTLNDSLTNVTLDAPENTKADYKNNIVTWEVGTLDVVGKETPLVLSINAEHPTELQEGTLIASAVTDTFLNEQGEEMIEDYDDFNVGLPAPSTPEFKLNIALKSAADCVYTLEFIATNSSAKPLTYVTYTYGLDTESFEWQSPIGNSNFTSSTWKVGSLAAGASVKNTAIVKYTGLMLRDDKPVFMPIDGTAKYDDKGLKNAKYTGISYYKQDVHPCPPPPPDCCENCTTPETANFVNCEQSKDVNITAALVSNGREIKVKVKLNDVCRSKNIVVGLELFSGEPGSQTAVRRTFKVLSLPPSGMGCGNRECDCATFFIPNASCTSQKFFIKAQAHYYANDDIKNSVCDCTCPTTTAVLE